MGNRANYEIFPTGSLGVLLGIFAIELLCLSLRGFDASVRDQVLDGDTTALGRLKELPKDDQFEIIYSCLFSLVRQPILREKHPMLVRDLATQFVSMSNHGEFLREKIESQGSGSGRYREAFFQVSSLLRSREVERLLAELVFDERIHDSHGSLVSGLYSPQNSHLAAKALGEMKLVDSPLPKKDPMFYDQNDIERWKEWASGRLRISEGSDTPSFLEEQGIETSEKESSSLGQMKLVRSDKIIRWLVVISVVFAILFLFIRIRRQHGE